MAFHAEVARQIFCKLPEEEQKAVRERAANKAKKARDRYIEAQKKAPSQVPEDQQRWVYLYVDNIADVRVEQ